MSRWKRFKSVVDVLNFQIQRFITLSLSVFCLLSGFLNLLFIMTNEGPMETEELQHYLKMGLAHLSIGCVAGWMYVWALKNRYPNYPNHRETE
jgi:hypothetical protein